MIDTLLFVLVGSAVSVALIVVFTGTAWWFLSDYYMADRWPGWETSWESFAFLSVSLFVLVVSLAFQRWQLAESIANLIPWSAGTARLSAPQRNRLSKSSPVPEDHVFNAEIARFLLELVKPDMRWAVRGFVSWKQRHVASGEKRWLPAAWFPLVLGALSLLPETSAFGMLASAASGNPNVIFDISASGRSPGRVDVEESLEHRPPPATWHRKHTREVEQGTITVRSTSFPHLRHRLKVTCVAELCDVSPGLGIERGDVAEVDVQNGVSRFDYYQTNPDQILGIHLELIGVDGTVVDEAFIDPPIGEERASE